MKQVVAPDRSDEYVGPAVVVVIADRHAHAVEGDRQPGRCGNVFEGAVAFVAVQGQSRRWTLVVLMPRPITGIHEQDVLPAVPVIVEKRDSRAHCLRQKLLAESAIGVPEGDAGGLGDVGEAYYGNRHTSWRGARSGGGVVNRRP